VAKQNIEAAIRDFLAEDVGVIEPGLVLIKDEYHLRNPNGASGFIDLFAKDADDNLVVIEVKRSDSAEREAITELAKYAALLRLHKNIKASELRLIVVSTSWRELLVPFSEFYHSTSYQLDGFKLEIDEANRPVKLDRVVPLLESTGRRLSRRHLVRFYRNDIDLHDAEEKWKSALLGRGISDFVLARLRLNFIDPYYGATRALYFAQQLQSREFYLDVISRHLPAVEVEEVMETVSGLDTEDILEELADASTYHLDIPAETMQIGSPEKFNQHVEQGTWEVLSIRRNGIFTSDERLTDEHLIADLCGHTGASFVHYFAAFKVQNRAKFSEVRTEIDNALFNNDKWRHAVEDILRYAQRLQASTITLHVFSRDDLFETVWLSQKASLARALPSFLAVLDFADSGTTEVFYGKLRWRATSVNFAAVLRIVFEGSFGNYLIHRHFGEQRAVDADVLSLMGFEYTVDYSRWSNKEQIELRDVVVRGSTVRSHEDGTLLDFEQFLKQNSSLVKEIVSAFDTHHMGGGMFQF
jgi:hypothetical protein